MEIRSISSHKSGNDTKMQNTEENDLVIINVREDDDKNNRE